MTNDRLSELNTLAHRVGRLESELEMHRTQVANRKAQNNHQHWTSITAKTQDQIDKMIEQDLEVQLAQAKIEFEFARAN